MSDIVRLSWSNQTETVKTKDVDAALDRIGSDLDPAPQGVSLQRVNGDTLLVVLGGSESFLNFASASLDAPHFSSRGDSDTDDPFVLYVGGDHYSEVPRRLVVDVALAREAVREFVSRDAGLPGCISWEQD